MVVVRTGTRKNKESNKPPSPIRPSQETQVSSTAMAVNAYFCTNYNAKIICGQNKKFHWLEGSFVITVVDKVLVLSPPCPLSFTF